MNGGKGEPEEKPITRGGKKERGTELPKRDLDGNRDDSFMEMPRFRDKSSVPLRDRRKVNIRVAGVSILIWQNCKKRCWF